MIQLSELTKTFGDRVLFDHVTWQITDRERVGLCGPNGAGKTTLLKMMAGLDEPDEGAILKPSALTRRLPAAGRPQPRRPHRCSRKRRARSASCSAMKAEMHALEERLGDESIPEAEHDAMLHRYSDLQDRFRVARRLQHRAEDGDGAAGPRLQDRRLRAADRDVLRRLADAHRAGQAAARRAQPAAARRADQPPRPRGAQLARGVPQRLPATR